MSCADTVDVSNSHSISDIQSLNLDSESAASTPTAGRVSTSLLIQHHLQLDETERETDRQADRTSMFVLGLGFFLFPLDYCVEFRCSLSTREINLQNELHSHSSDECWLATADDRFVIFLTLPYLTIRGRRFTA